MIEAGAAGVHFEDQLSSAKKCGHLGGKVLVPTSRGRAEVGCGPPGGRRHGRAHDCDGAHRCQRRQSDHQRYRPAIDRQFLTGEPRTPEGFYRIRSGLNSAIARGLAYAPYADLIWCETSEPNLDEAGDSPKASTPSFPDKMLAYNCSPSFNWKKKLDDATIAKFQRELAAMGYKFQFITLAGFHALNLSMFELARGYKESGMTAYSRLQEKEFSREKHYGYAAVKHQRFVGTGYFDEVHAGHRRRKLLHHRAEGLDRRRAVHAQRLPRAREERHWQSRLRTRARRMRRHGRAPEHGAGEDKKGPGSRSVNRASRDAVSREMNVIPSERRLASRVEESCGCFAVGRQRKTQDPSTPRPNSFLLIKCGVGYAAWLLRPQALGASVGMTLSETSGYTNSGIALNITVSPGR